MEPARHPHSLRTFLHRRQTLGGTAVSAETIRRSRTRLTAAALVYAGVYAVAYVVGFVFGPAAGDVGLGELLGPVAVVWSLAMATAFRSRRLPDRWVVAAGMSYYVLGALLIDAATYSGFFRAGVWPNGLSWVAVWIVVFPLLVPAPPLRLLLAALAAAATGPLTFAAALAWYGPPPEEVPPGVVIVVLASYFICAVTAWICSRLLHRLRREAASARELGSYTLERLLGRGGMGEVWLAHHRLLARPAAIKLLRPERLRQAGIHGDDTLVLRFEREARATASLRSPHTVSLYDFGLTDEGGFYYAMEYLEGTDLERLVERNGPIPASRAVYFLVQACESLEEAHGHDLVHRDIKPSNLFTCQLGTRHDVLKILDFGLVTALPTAPLDVRLTMQEGLTGTPAYMPPEMALHPDDVDARADIYALGCVAYWLLTGRQVFKGDGAMSVVLQHVRDEPLPPSAISEVSIPEALESLVMRCLAKDPAERPATAAELASALRDCGIHPWTREDADTWWRLHGPDLERSGATPVQENQGSRPAR